MTCTELNFVSSQHFYGLCIANKDSLPGLDASDAEWLPVLTRLNTLAIASAKMQIAHNKKEAENG